MDEENTLIQLVKQSPRDLEPWKTLPEFFDFIPGVYMYQQAAREIADAEGWSDVKLQALLDVMQSAMDDGSLPTRCRKTAMVIAPNLLDSLPIVTVDDVNVWLEKRDVRYRWHLAEPTWSSAEQVSETLAAPAAAAEPPAAAEWISSAQSVASEYIQRHKELDLFPSQADVCRHVEGVMRKGAIFGSHGKPLSAAYISRNAIQGEWWQRNKP